MEEKGVEYEPCTVPGTVVYLAAEKEFLGTIVISDTSNRKPNVRSRSSNKAVSKRQLCLPVTEKMSVKQ